MPIPSQKNVCICYYLEAEGLFPPAGKHLTCSRVLIPCLILLTETSESDKKLIILNLSGAYSKN